MSVSGCTKEDEKLIFDAKFVDNYIKLAKRTESLGSESQVRVLRCMRLLHGGMGCVTEAGELLDNLKKHIFYGKPIDEVNLMEEIGDIFWYSAIILDVLGYEWVKVMQLNIQKLQARYPQKFEADQALIRDLLKERQILENTDGSA